MDKSRYPIEEINPSLGKYILGYYHPRNGRYLIFMLTNPTALQELGKTDGFPGLESGIELIYDDNRWFVTGWYTSTIMVKDHIFEDFVYNDKSLVHERKKEKIEEKEKIDGKRERLIQSGWIRRNGVRHWILNCFSSD